MVAEPKTDDINFAALVKGTERYIFAFRDDQVGDLLLLMGRFASDPDLSFTYYDAAMMSKHLRRPLGRRRPAEGRRDGRARQPGT